MAIVETLFYDQSRRAFLRMDYLFARRRSREGQPPRRPPQPDSPLGQPPDWNWFGKKVSRRTVIGVGSLLAGLGVGAFVVDRLGLLKIFPTLPNHEFREDWLKLPPKERIKRLEFKQYPKISDFDASGEMIRAVSEYYCQASSCNKAPIQLQQSVMITGRDRIIEEVEFDNDRKLTEEEREKIGKETIEMFGVKRGFILISQENLQREANAVTTNNPGLIAEIEGRDLYTVMFKSVLFHAFTHANADRSNFAIAPITIPSAIPVDFDRISEGFVFFGRRRNGVPVMVHGANEAIVEYIATYIAQDTGPYIGPPVYKRGVRIIEQLNLRANLPADTFIEYNTGRKPKQELFRVWGSLKNRFQPDDYAALQALFTIGLLIDSPSTISPEPFVEKVEQLLRP